MRGGFIHEGGVGIMKGGGGGLELNSVNSKSIHVDLGRFCELLVQRAWPGPGRPQQCPRFLPSVLVFHELDQLPDLLADDSQGLREVLLQRCLLCEVVRVLLTEHLEGKACGNTPNWLPHGSVVVSCVVLMLFRFGRRWPHCDQTSVQFRSDVVHLRFNVGSSLDQMCFTCGSI